MWRGNSFWYTEWRVCCLSTFRRCFRGLASKTIRLNHINVSIFIFFAAIFSADASVIPAFHYENDFGLYGQTENTTTCPPGDGGVCAAMASINSFAYLQARYPHIYRGRLLPNGDNDPDKPGIQANIDALNFAVNGWDVPGSPGQRRLGYYQRSTLPGFDPNRSYVETKLDWFFDFVPGTTTVIGSFGIGVFPQISFLAEEIRQGEDVEFFVRKANDTLFAHALTLIGVSCATDNYTNCVIQFQDPNNPGRLESANLVGLAGGVWNFEHPTFGGVYIDAAFAESPIPAPGGLVFLIAGFSAVLLLRHRRFEPAS